MTDKNVEGQPLSCGGAIPPSIGRVVIYRSRTGNYDEAAIITATEDTLWRPGVEAGHVPDLSGPTHVHLHVLTPGAQGSYTEHNVPLNTDHGDPLPCSWRWPEIKRAT